MYVYVNSSSFNGVGCYLKVLFLLLLLIVHLLSLCLYSFCSIKICKYNYDSKLKIDHRKKHHHVLVKRVTFGIVSVRCFYT